MFVCIFSSFIFSSFSVSSVTKHRDAHRQRAPVVELVGVDADVEEIHAVAVLVQVDVDGLCIGGDGLDQGT